MGVHINLSLDQADLIISLCLLHYLKNVKFTNILDQDYHQNGFTGVKGYYVEKYCCCTKVQEQSHRKPQSKNLKI